MKKLIFAIAGAALVGVAVAGEAVETYQWKASVKHTYIKEVGMPSTLKAYSKLDKAYAKCAKTTSLKGYLVQDVSGSLAYDTGVKRVQYPAIAKDDVQPGNRCFLVVMNGSAEKGNKFVRIIPGFLDVKWYSSNLKASSTVMASGFLKLGGETVANAEGGGFRGTAFDELDGIAYTNRTFAQWERTPSCSEGTEPNDALDTRASRFGQDDYWFTSCFLFGKYNQPSWYNGSLVEFADAWLNCSGLGKAKFTESKINACCGRTAVTQREGFALDSLSGYLKGGFWLCSEAGTDAAHTIGTYRSGLFEDQLWTSIDANNADGFTYVQGGVGLPKLDVWADGDIDQRANDVCYGNWSIKRTTSVGEVNLTDGEKATIAAWGFAGPASEKLMSAIKAAAVKLDKNVKLFGNPVDGAMINYSFFKNYLARDNAN